MGIPNSRDRQRLKNKLLSDDIKNKQKLIVSILEHNSHLIQAQNVFAQNPAIGENSDIVVIHTGTNDPQNNCQVVKKAKKLVSAVGVNKELRKNCVFQHLKIRSMMSVINFKKVL